MHIIELETGCVEQRDDGLFIFRPRARVDLTGADVRAYLATAYERAQGKAFAVVDRRARYSLTFEAQELLRREAGKYMAAMAYVATPGAGYSIATMTVEQLSAQLPARVFLDEEEALSWLGALQREAGEDSE